MIQSELLAVTISMLKAREKSHIQNPIGFV